MELNAFRDEESWLECLTSRFERNVAMSLLHQQTCHIMVSTGSACGPFLTALRDRELPWTSIEWWLSNEACVLPDEVGSRERQLYDTLFSPGMGGFQPPYKFHSWYNGADWPTCAANYGRRIEQVLGAEPVFDLVILELGEEGQVAGLFTDTPGLYVADAPTTLNAIPQWQTTWMTVTLPLLQRSRDLWILAAAPEQQVVAERLAAYDGSIPAGCIEHQRISFFWKRS